MFISLLCCLCSQYHPEVLEGKRRIQELGLCGRALEKPPLVPCLRGQQSVGCLLIFAWTNLPHPPLNFLCKIKKPSFRAGSSISLKLKFGLVEKSCLILCDACQVPLSVGCSRPEYWSGLLFPSQGDLPDPGIEPGSPALQVDCLPAEPSVKPQAKWRTAIIPVARINRGVMMCWYQALLLT